MFTNAAALRNASVVLLLGGIAFVNALGAVIVFPLAPFIAADLAVPVPEAAFSTVYYNGAAGLGGILGFFVLRHVSRRRGLIVTLTGMGGATGIGAFAPDFPLLMLSRLAAGFCAGPLLAMIIATTSDLTSEDMRGRAVGAIVGSYGLAMLVGAPVAVALISLTGTWRAAFGLLALSCLLLSLPLWLGALGQNGGGKDPGAGQIMRGIRAILAHSGTVSGLLLTGMASFATLLIAPHIGSFAVNNVAMSEAQLQSVYIIGGGLALLTTGGTGWLIDRIGPFGVSLAVAGLLSLLLVYAFLVPQPLPNMVLALGMLLAAQLGRSAVAQTSASLVSRVDDRIAYQCLVSAVTSAAQAAGAATSMLLLSEGGDGVLIGMERVALISIALCWISSAVVARLERRRHALRNEA